MLRGLEMLPCAALVLLSMNYSLMHNPQCHLQQNDVVLHLTPMIVQSNIWAFIPHNYNLSFFLRTEAFFHAVQVRRCVSRTVEVLAHF